MDGILVVRKEKGYTSHDVVAKLRGILRMKKIGHTGTLDPEAEGVLPVALGKGTRLVEMLTEKKKTYEAVMRLGTVTDTQDMTGTVLETHSVQLKDEEILAACRRFEGAKEQIPPMYSALKVNGKKLCDLAREGKVVERRPRPVHFYEIQVSGIELPLVRLRVTCSKGTYIRTLCHDIGRELGCGGCMESLLRTASGAFTLKDSHTLREIETAAADGSVAGMIIPVEEVLADYPRLCVAAEGDRLLQNGNALPQELVKGEEKKSSVRFCTSAGVFAGLYHWDGSRQRYCPEKMFL